jgi:hypothetical protein
MEVKRKDKRIVSLFSPRGEGGGGGGDVAQGICQLDIFP